MAFVKKGEVAIDASKLNKENRKISIEKIIDETKERFLSNDNNDFAIIACGNTGNNQITLQFSGGLEPLQSLSALIMQTVAEKTTKNEYAAAIGILIMFNEVIEQMPAFKKADAVKTRKMLHLSELLAQSLYETVINKEDKA